VLKSSEDPIGDLPVTGRGFTLDDIIIHRLEDGKLAETRVSWENVAFQPQLALVPPTITAAE
jgi:predicted ester cyclase